jgi:hypothetical protein
MSALQVSLRLAFNFFVGFLALLFNQPALADITATYEREEERGSFVVEIGDNGAMRFGNPKDGYILIVEGKVFSIDAGPGGPKVTTAEAIAYRERKSVEEGTTTFSSNPEDKKLKFIRYAPGADVNIAGFDGTVYAVANTSRADIVLTTEPSLLALGKAVASYSKAIDMMSAKPADLPDNLDALLASHGVLKFWFGKLATVSFEKIDPSHFSIPAEPIGLADVEEPKAAEDKKASRNSDVMKAAYLGGTLYTLTSDGNVEAWTEGARQSRKIKTPKNAHELCALGGKLFVVEAKRGARKITLWSGSPGVWTSETEIELSEENYFLSLDCSGAEPLLLTSDAIKMPQSGKSIPIKLDATSYRGYFTTLQHGGFLYVGANAGEWGGGLQRISLTTGNAELVDASEPKELCGGTLNKDCDPVTGLAPDPIRPDCILATVGLVHFFPKGSILRVCGKQISLVYSKPYTLATNWRFDPAISDDSFSSVPFFSMGHNARGAWAVGNDGIYRFADEEVPSFTAFPKIYRLPDAGIDWSNPDFILILTGMNQSHSISGNSLLIVPRLP